MKSNFDDILQKGKQSATKMDPDAVWRNNISNLMHALIVLNKMYGSKSDHHVSVKQKRCDSCGIATFILDVSDINKRSDVIAFHEYGWKSTSTNVYYCKKCKGDK